jgi:hypothetical protein
VNLIGRVESGFFFTAIVELVNEDSQAMLCSGEIGSYRFATVKIIQFSETMTSVSPRKLRERRSEMKHTRPMLAPSLAGGIER